MEHWKNLDINDLPGEDWKDVVGWEGNYMVSNMGRVKTIPCEKRRRSRICKQYRKENGYPYTCLGKKNFLTHRIVCKAFLPNPEDKPQVNHKNSIRDDNRLENLEWVTRSENAIHSFVVGKRKPNANGTGRFGALNHMSKPTAQYDASGNLIKIWDGASTAARALSINDSSLRKAIRMNKDFNGFKWAHV